MADTDASLFENCMTYEDVMPRLKMSKRTLERLVSKGEIPHKRIGRYVRFYWPAIEKWLLNDGAKKR